MLEDRGPEDDLNESENQMRKQIETIDDIDVALLKLLSHDARASLKNLGAEVGLSGPAVADRIARLIERGIVSGFSVTIDWARLGLPTIAYISLLTDKTRDIACIVDAVKTIPYVQEVSIVTGTTDLMVRARVADLTDLHELLVNHIWPIEGMERVETSLAVQTESVDAFAPNMLQLCPAAPLPQVTLTSRTAVTP